MLGDFFFVVTPIRLTSSGSLASATETRFCTSTWAVSRFGAQLEGHVQEHLAVVRAARRHVQHPLDAVDLLLDGRGHGGGHRLRIGAGIDGRDLDRRRGHLGILGDRQAASSATSPTMTITSESTVAKIGRSTKKRANMYRPSPSL